MSLVHYFKSLAIAVVVAVVGPNKICMWAQLLCMELFFFVLHESSICNHFHRSEKSSHKVSAGEESLHSDSFLYNVNIETLLGSGLGGASIVKLP